MGRLLTLMILVLGAFGCGMAPKVDEWEKSKECATQAEHLMKEGAEINPGIDWSTNHYSPKYNKCYIEVKRTFTGTSTIYLLDAFERVKLASWVQGVSKRCSMKSEGINKYADLDFEPSQNCDKVRAFIDEHMKN